MSSVGFDKIVPFGQKFVLDDVPLALTLKEWVAFSSCLVDSSVDRCKHSESRSGCGPGSHLACFFDRVEHGSAPCSGNLREKPVLNGVPLGAVGRVMRNSDINPQFLRGLDETPLELPVPCIVGSATVTEDEYALCIWIYVSEVLFPLLDKAVTGELRSVMAHAEGHVASVPARVIDAMRYHLSVGERGVVMVVHLHRLSGVGTAVVPSEIAKHLLLLRVHAEYGNTCLFARSSQLLNIAELFVTEFALCHGQGLYRLAAGISLGTDDLPDDIEAYIYMILLREYLFDLRGAKPEPLRVGVLRKPGDVKLHYLAEDSDILGELGKCFLPAASLLTYSVLIEVFLGLKLMATSVDGVTGYGKLATDKAYAMSAIPFCYNGDELPRLSLVRVFEVLHFLVCYYFCWIIRAPHNCLKYSYKGTNFLADCKI